MPPKPTTRLFGSPALGLPNILQYGMFFLPSPQKQKNHNFPATRLSSFSPFSIIFLATFQSDTLKASTVLPAVTVASFHSSAPIPSTPLPSKKLRNAWFLPTSRTSKSTKKNCLSRIGTLRCFLWSNYAKEKLT